MAEVDYERPLRPARQPRGRTTGRSATASTCELGDGRAEVAFAVADEMQGHGLGHDPARPPRRGRGRRTGSTTFVAEVMPQNHRMVEMFRESGFPVEIRASAEGLRVEFPTSLSPEAIDRFEDRDRLAAVAAVEAFLEPRSIAVVGASRRPRHASAARCFTTCSSPASRAPSTRSTRRRDRSSRCRRSRASPRSPARSTSRCSPSRPPRLAAVARECAAKGARALVVLSAGFAEVGAGGGRSGSASCSESAARRGMRLIGPNCLGILDTDPERGLNVTFAPERAAAPATSASSPRAAPSASR